MKVLMITEKFPYPPIDGVRLKVYNMLKGLSKMHEIHFVSFIDKGESIDLSKIEGMCTKIDLIERLPRKLLLLRGISNLFEKTPFSLKVFSSSMIRRRLEEIVKSDSFDLVHLDMPNMAQFRGIVSHLPTFFAPHDSMSLNLRRRISFEGTPYRKLYQYIQYIKWRTYEKSVYYRFDKCFVVSESDKEELLSLNSSIDVVMAPNGVNTDFYKPLGLSTEFPSVVFSGSMEAFQSIDAVLNFYETSYARIKIIYPNIKFYIVGKDPHKSILDINERDKSVIVTGYVDDVRPYIDKATIYVCPMRMGSGIKNRLLEAIAMGKPIVATSISCEGIEFENNKNVIMADTAVEFSNAVIGLLKDDGVRNTLAQNALTLAKERYSWDRTIKVIDSAYNDAVLIKSKHSVKPDIFHTRSRLSTKTEGAMRLAMVRYLSGSLPLYIVTEYPKSGGTWVSQMLSHYLGVPFPRNQFPPLKSCIIQGHYLYSPKMKNVVVVFRDGRDVMVSYYYYSLFLQDINNERIVNYTRKKLKFKDYDDIASNLPKFIEYNFTQKSPQKFTWSEFVNDWQGRESVFVKYISLLKDTHAEMSKIIKSLTNADVDEDRLKAAVEKYSFKNLTGRERGKENKHNFLRKGITGDWKNHFTQETKEVFNKYAGKELIKLGYEPDDGWVRR